MKAETFEISGKFAHWKKFFTNSSSLTYYFPTRTNIIGTIASILEMERDSYYDKLNKDKLKIAVAINSNIKKKITVLNYLNTKNNDGWIKGKNMHTQIKFELLIPYNLREESIKYKIYLSAKTNETEGLIDKLVERVKSKKLGFGVYLGQRQFKAHIKYLGNQEIIPLENAKEVSTVCLKENIEGEIQFGDNDFYVSDIIPTDFNNKREISETKEVIINLKGQIKIKKGQIKEVFKLENGENICFL